jgi:gamma-tubulin complex component 5
MFFYANNAVTIDEAAFWEMSYMLRVRGSPVDSSSSLTNSESIKKKESGNQESTAAVAASKASKQGSVDISCPVFLKDIARAIVSAGKSFQLIKHVQDVHRIEIHKGKQGLNVDDTSCNNQRKF